MVEFLDFGSDPVFAAAAIVSPRRWITDAAAPFGRARDLRQRA